MKKLKKKIEYVSLSTLEDFCPCGCKLPFIDAQSIGRADHGKDIGPIIII